MKTSGNPRKSLALARSHPPRASANAPFGHGDVGSTGRANPRVPSPWHETHPPARVLRQSWGRPWFMTSFQGFIRLHRRLSSWRMNLSGNSPEEHSAASGTIEQRACDRTDDHVTDKSNHPSQPRLISPMVRNKSGNPSRRPLLLFSSFFLPGVPRDSVIVKVAV